VVEHGFFGRSGGISAGPYSSLNVSFTVGDDVDKVEHNRQRILQMLGCEGFPLATVDQVHGAHVVVVSSREEALCTPVQKADALVTDVPGIALGVMTADCAPILLCDPGAPRIAAVHAGWRGALLGVVEETLRILEAKGSPATSLVAVIGPCIQRASYQVSEAFRHPFLEKNPHWSRFFQESASSVWTFDLPQFLCHRLTELGVKQWEALPIDTYTHTDFFSFRRAQRETQGLCGRQMSVIALKRSISWKGD
jgi:YfiH family protein